MPAKNTPPTRTLRRAYFQDMKSPVHVDIRRAKAVAPKNIFIGSGFGAADAVAGAGDFGSSGFGPSAFVGAGGVALRGGKYRVPFLCNCER
jgi:hypothetical protein